ncbi:MAG: sulfurtransferase TusA family protein [Actinobacteria bacterium]|nr:sulfurtransferase TusA family protein [Actinomycetota bacterium]
MSDDRVGDTSSSDGIDRPDCDLNLKGEVCPYTFVRSLLALEDLEPGQTLRITVDYQPAVGNIPKSLKIYGHTVLSIRRVNETDWEIVARKAGG